MNLRKSLLQSVDDLKKEVVMMADIALANLREALSAFKTTDKVAAEEIMKKDDVVDRYEEEIAKHALKMIWKEQPVASE